jgi:hypothetical protein
MFGSREPLQVDLLEREEGDYHCEVWVSLGRYHG